MVCRAGRSCNHGPGQRIRALRAKTVAQGCTQQEALAAAAKAAELLDGFGVSLGELEFRAQPCDGIGIQTNRRRFAPIDTCIPSISAFFDCRVCVEQAAGERCATCSSVCAAMWRQPSISMTWSGERSGPRRTISVLARSLAGERRSATNSFQVGLGRGICDKLAHMQAARDASRRGLSGRDQAWPRPAQAGGRTWQASVGRRLHGRRSGRSAVRIPLGDHRGGMTARRGMKPRRFLAAAWPTATADYSRRPSTASASSPSTKSLRSLQFAATPDAMHRSFRPLAIHRPCLL